MKEDIKTLMSLAYEAGVSVTQHSEDLYTETGVYIKTEHYFAVEGGKQETSNFCDELPEDLRSSYETLNDDDEDCDYYGNGLNPVRTTYFWQHIPAISYEEQKAIWDELDEETAEAIEGVVDAIILMQEKIAKANESVVYPIILMQEKIALTNEAIAQHKASLVGFPGATTKYHKYHK